MYSLLVNIGNNDTFLRVILQHSGKSRFIQWKLPTDINEIGRLQCIQLINTNLDITNFLQIPTKDIGIFSQANHPMYPKRTYQTG